MKKLYISLFPILFIFYVNCFAQSDPLTGACEIYNTSQNDLYENVFYAYDFLNTWSSVTQINYGGEYYLLFYDRAGGQAVIFDSNMTFRRSYRGLKKSWSQIIAHDFDNDGNDELFMYDFSAGTAEINSLGTYLELIPVASFHSLRKTWKDIICLDREGENKNEFLFYDANNRTANIYKINGNKSGKYTLDLLWGNSYWRNTWKLLSKISFPDGTRGILAYDPYNNNGKGHISLFKYDDAMHSAAEISLNTDFPKNITDIKSGNFGSSLQNGNLMFYIRETGDCYFYTAGNNELIPGPVELGWSDSWKFISVLKTNIGTDNILFYDSPEDNIINIKTYDGTNQAVHPDVIKGHGGKYIMVFTPFPFSTDDFENPSVLESNDGVEFTEIPGSKKPLIDMPHPPAGFSRAYNNDPDVYYENGKYYMVYNETFAVKNTFFQNVKMVMYDSNFCNPDSSTVLAEPNYSRLTFAPSLIKSSNKYYIFFVTRTATGRHKISFISNNELRTGWNNQIIQNAVFNTTADFQPWHLNVFKNDYDGYFYMLIAGKYNVPSWKDNDLYIARSRDLLTWDLAPEPLIRKENYSVAQVYRSAGLFERKNYLTLWYSYYSIDDEPGIGIKKNILIDSIMFKGGRTIKKTDVVQLANYPNPFNASTRINFDMPFNARITMKVYDITGREIQRLINNEFRSIGNYTVNFNAARLSSGIYFVVIAINGDDDIKAISKMVLLK
ncbi:MAG: T9SS type A sorting domain-containing protein [Ignavibacteria bacterium]|nr:T9SS type A sorting domain-containing protein [Ignavibacteria bacterium]